MRASQILSGLPDMVGAAPVGSPGPSVAPEMDGGIEQNPAYGTAQALRPIDKGISRIAGGFDPNEKRGRYSRPANSGSQLRSDVLP